ncbi:MAG: class A beta-lactamase [Novosphingobium sp.]
MIDRRKFALGAGAMALVGCAKAEVSAAGEAGAAARLAALEAPGARLGAYVLDTGSGRGFGWRSRERFGMCSTFKLSLAAYCLREGDAGRLALGEVLRFGKADLLPNSPVTTANLAQGGMTIAALAEATQITSDNAAANLLLKRIGGPAAITRFWRELGDPHARLDRYEMAMNRVAPGEEHDTVTPEGIARSVAKFALGDVLAPTTRARLNDWMARTQTGLKRIRAALPPGWRGGDKTGTGSFSDLATKINDIAVLTPPGGRAPLVVAAFYEAPLPFGDVRDADQAVLARVGEVAVQWAS